MKTVTITLKASDLGLLLFAILILGLGKPIKKQDRLAWLAAHLRIQREINAQLPSGKEEAK